MVDLTDADICNVIRAERKAATDESQKTIHILTEQREDYRKQVVFLEGQVKGLRSSTGSADMGAEPGPEWSAEYSQGWDDCLEAIHKVLGERFPRRVSLFVSASISPNIKTIDDAAVDIVARAINRADTHGTEKEEETLWNEI